jgi:DMSO/TMAO reductase YedYZ molybdopterin-dependent catalytic subunit
MKFNGLRFTNGLLLVLVLILTLSGLYGLFWTSSEVVFTLHRISGWAMLALLPWKGFIVFRSLRRKIHGNSHPGWLGVSLILAMLTLVVLVLGLLWKGRFGPVEYPLRQTAISWHWMLALGLLLPFALHVWKRWPRPRSIDFLSRRGFLRAALVTPLAALGYFGYHRLARAREVPQEPVRFTGSRRAGWFSGNDFPLTHSVAATSEQIALENWRLEVLGAIHQPTRIDYASLSQLPTTVFDATIDCTLGWYARQSWGGVLLVDLLQHTGLDQMPFGVQLISVTGYAHFLPWEEARQVLLATHVGGEPLSAGHGFPLRAVVPSRRGWFWVKWLGQIKVTF